MLTVYFLRRTTADVIWLYGDEAEPSHKVFRAQQLVEILQKPGISSAEEVLPFLVITKLLQRLERYRELAPPSLARGDSSRMLTCSLPWLIRYRSSRSRVLLALSRGLQHDL